MGSELIVVASDIVGRLLGGPLHKCKSKTSNGGINGHSAIYGDTPFDTPFNRTQVHFDAELKSVVNETESGARIAEFVF
ncbi:hypothetical protein PC39_14837 [Salinisphaera sp. PC39]